MFYSQLHFAKQLDQEILKTTYLTNLQEKKSPVYVKEVQNWLKNIEEILQSQKSFNSSQIATLRSRLLTAMNKPIKGNSKRKYIVGEAAECMRLASEVVYDIVAPIFKKSYEVKPMLRQAISLGVDKVPEFKSENADVIIQIIWEKIKANEQLKQLVAHLKYNYNLIDIRILILEELSEMEFLIKE